MTDLQLPMMLFMLNFINEYTNANFLLKLVSNNIADYYSCRIYEKMILRMSACQNYVLKFRLPANISLVSSFHCSPVSYSFEDLQTLGLAENATKDEIKAAYFTKAKQFHPDSSSRYVLRNFILMVLIFI